MLEFIKLYIEGSLTSISVGGFSILKQTDFRNQGLLQLITLTECTSLATGSIFTGCSRIQSIYFPKLTSIPSWGFYMMGTSLTTVLFPKCTFIGSYAFSYCYKLTTISFPECLTVGVGAFLGCRSSLTTVSFPKCTVISNGAFSGCWLLQTAYFPKCIDIASSTFYSCTSLTSLYVGTEINSVCTLRNSNAFTYTGISTSGTIYVPASLLTNYQAATNWTYFSNRFVGV